MPFRKKMPPAAEHMRTVRPTPRGQVFSYHANRSVRIGGAPRSLEEQQHALRRQPRFSWLKRIPSLVTLLIVLLIAVFCLRLGDNASVVTAGTGKGRVFLRDQKVYETAARDLFRQVLNSNKLTVDADKLSADFKRQFPELTVVSVSLPIIGSRPVVYIQPATPKMILLGKGGMFLLDANGRALMPANQAPKLEGLRIPVVNDQSDVRVEAGRVVLPKAIVAFIDEIVGQHEAKSIKIISLALPPGTNELHVRLEGAGYLVKYNLHGDAREEAGSFLALKAHLEAERKTPKEYIDVRVENRAYYK
ncbi:MAG: hypothetical protein AAB834_04330 [Patescibacteria group bacterium]